GVEPRITAPSAITAAYLPDVASLCAASAISHAPGTRTRSMLSSFTPWRSSASRAPATSGSTTKPLKRPATMAKRPLGVAKSPSMVFMVAAILDRPGARARWVFYGFGGGGACAPAVQPVADSGAPQWRPCTSAPAPRTVDATVIAALHA